MKNAEVWCGAKVANPSREKKHFEIEFMSYISNHILTQDTLKLTYIGGVNQRHIAS